MLTSMASHHPFFVCLFFTSVLVLSANPSVAQSANAVLDSEGDEVRIGSEYHLRLDAIGFFGGVTRLRLPNITACARNIGLADDETYPGMPTMFTPGIPSQASSGVLGLGMRSEIEFQLITPAICAAPGLWTTQANSSDADGGLFTAIVAGSELDTESTSAWFEVRPTRKARVYKLIYCPCLACRIRCFQPVGFVGNVLGFGGEPFTFRLIKATDNLALAAV